MEDSCRVTDGRWGVLVMTWVEVLNQLQFGCCEVCVGVGGLTRQELVVETIDRWRGDHEPGTQLLFLELWRR